jgi:hypothetical protein
MSTKTKRSLDVEVTSLVLSNGAILDNQNQVLDPKETGALLKNLERGGEITAEMYEWEEGETARFFIVGTRKIRSLEDEEKTITCITAINEEGKKVILYDAVLRNNLLDIAESGKPTPVEIICTGINDDNKKRIYKTFEIYQLA